VYINYIDNVPNKVHWFDFDGFMTKISYEWLWHKILQFCTEDLLLNSTIILFTISFLILFSAISFVTYRMKNYWSAIFLFNPVFLDFVVSQSRLAFTMSIIFLAYFLRKRGNLLYIPLLLITPFIHTSSVLFIFLIGTAIYLEESKIMYKYFQGVGKTTIAIYAGLIVGIVTGPLMSIILGGIGDRRAEYDDMSSPITHLAFYLILVPYFLLKGYFEKSQKDLTFYVTIMLFMIIVLNTVFSGYPSRFIAALFPFFICALLSLKGKENILIWIAYLAYTALLWIFWFI
ncbi:EpsG family protein, partial [Acinetobacter baumannii]|nr:EpsG family protein [Acinetobacter baumannii]